MAINHDALIRRLNKAIEKKTAAESPSCVHLITEEDSIEGLTGLVVILAENSLRYAQPPKTAQNNAF